MTLIAEFELATPILRQARKVHPNITIHIETISQPAADEFKLIFWTVGPSHTRIDSALTSDPTVKSVSLLEETGDQCLYRVTLSKTGVDSLTYPVAVHYDITFLEIILKNTTQIRARVPDREALFSYRDTCREKEVSFRIHKLYQETPSQVDRFNLTARQEEALCTALEAGYFEVPRETKLSVIADDLDVSAQALSARLRRGQRNLLRSTLTFD